MAYSVAWLLALKVLVKNNFFECTCSIQGQRCACVDHFLSLLKNISGLWINRLGTQGPAFALLFIIYYSLSVNVWVGLGFFLSLLTSS